jgi:ribosome biogenesis protein Nip4
VSEASMRLGLSVARGNLVSLGTCIDKFTKGGKFMLHISALDVLAKYAKFKVCIWCVWQGWRNVGWWRLKLM